ncbi:saccharopine dehydrogenase NADP-binding domain-containing protein [Ignatzschineria rhizosphaerae]|uniref:Saccharopine dehydrogenase NADP-binding domain-containing protein n=1 Tax=Ignatzschineria rhizosphaerae TaxID=2923279 RepID=A0ABY3X673_9GAMM|nr:saccharopine dehydrogenase NADP-binding domain-containing protein [Ignatzschineria rhizosphaerae]UNM96962.1 saccharopine dehydrogenase NADP-binding domain-containing protein [Ignatzschineria rhizosphaerae]
MANLKASSPFTIMVLGGYGNFGELISSALSPKTDPLNQNIKLIIAGRNGQKAKILAETLDCNYCEVDVAKDDLAAIFLQHGVNLVISTVGPFQGQSYHIAQSALQANTHYIDLADSREFVAGISSLDNEAKAQQCFICAGASTVPGLSSAVINHHLSRFSALESIEICLSASEKVPGISTLSAVLSYAGETFTMLKNKQQTPVYGLQDLEHRKFYHLPKKRWVSNCNVPDLEIFPHNYPSLKNLSFKAGVGISLVQFSASFVAFLRRFKLFPHPVKYAGAFYKLAQKFERFGDGLSVMQVRLIGKDHLEKPLKINWEIIGYDNEGPNIPCFASIILARKLANNQLQDRGAFSSTNLITLEEYLAELKRLNIKTFTDIIS